MVTHDSRVLDIADQTIHILVSPFLLATTRGDGFLICGSCSPSPPREEKGLGDEEV